MALIIDVAIKLIIVLAPFFLLTVLLAKAEHATVARQRRIARKAATAIFIICLIIYFAGNLLLQSLGITLDAFRIGAGLVLLLSGLEMVRGSNTTIRSDSSNTTGNVVRDDATISDDDIAVVPLAIPCAIGPGTIGTLLVLGSDVGNHQLTSMLYELCGIFSAALITWLILHFANLFEKLFKKRGLSILSKLTGLFLVTLAAQIIAEGVKNITK